MPPSAPAVPGNGLVAILLMTRSRPGPRLVFHYPEDPTSTLDAEDNNDDADLSSESSEDEVRISRTPVHARTTRFADISELVPSLGKLGLHGPKTISGGEILTGKVLGHSVESLEKVLSPGRWSDGKKFEICLDGFTYVGHPVYAPEDGEWSPKPQQRESQKKTRNGDPGFLDVESFQTSGDTTPLVDRNGQEKTPADYDFSHIPDSFEEKAQHPRLGSSMESSSTNSISTTPAESLTMFQIVLVLSPAATASPNEMHTSIVQKLSKALHYCQKQSNYVSSETRKLLAMKIAAKQKHRFTREDERQLWKKMIDSSELAWSLKEIYEKISIGEVAAFRLNGMEMALQLPYTPAEGGENTVDPNSGILLLHPRETLLNDLASQPEAAPLAHFIAELTSTKTLAKQSLQLNIPLPSILHLAQHLITWRKARMLAAPLHWRNIYVVAPDAPVQDLGRHCEKYKELFPTLPSLPNMLKVLSGRPIRYGLLVPSRDHRGKYMEILEWLTREGWVVQLRTFGWVRVPKAMLAAKAERGRFGSEALMFGRLSEVAVFDDDGGSVSSERTAIANGGKGAHRRLSELAAQNSVGGRKRGSDSTAQGSVTFSEREEGGDGMVLVTDPGKEVHLLANLQDELFANDDEESREILAIILPFLDGECAFEGLSTRCALKRSRVEKVLEELEGRGWMRSLKSI